MEAEEIVSKISKVRQKIASIEDYKEKLISQKKLTRSGKLKLSKYSNRYDQQLDRLANEYLKLAGGINNKT